MAIYKSNDYKGVSFAISIFHIRLFYILKTIFMLNLQDKLISHLASLNASNDA